MSWPANPIDGQQVTINGVLYQYDATPGVWNRVGSGVSSVAVDSFTAANLTVTNLASLGDVGNVRISGGNAGYSLVTDGEGNLSWAGLGNAVTPGGSNTQVQYNDDGNFQGSANFTFNSSTETLSVTKIVGNGSGLTNLNGANVTGVVPNANFASNSNFATTAGNATNAVNATNATTAGTVTTNSQPNITSVGTLSNLTVAGNITASSITAQTFGAHQGPVGNVTPNTGAFTSLSATGNAVVSGNVSAGNVNVSGLVSANLVTGTLTTAAQPNITSVGTLTSLNINGEVTGHLIPSDNEVYDLGSPTKRWRTLYISANTISLGDANISANGNTITTSGTFGSDNVSITGQYTTTVATGTAPFVVYSNTVVANLNASLLNGLTATSANVASTIVSRDTNRNFSANIIQARLFGQANTATNVIASAQPNITSVGTLTGLTVNGNITTNNANLGNAVTANFFVGNGSLLTGLPGANVTGSLSNSVLANTNVYVGTTLINLARESAAQTLTGVSIDGNAGYSNTAGTVTSNAQPNITSLGTLTGLTVNGNLIVSGTTHYANVNTLNIKDPIIEIGGNPNGDPLSGDDGKDRGALLHYFSDSPVDAFMGWDTSNSEFIFAQNVAMTADVVTVNEYGNIRANNIIANVVGSINFAETANNISGNSQPNITSVGNLVRLNVTTGSISNSTPLNVIQTWNNASMVFTGIRENIIDTNSSGDSLLIDLQVGGASQFSVRKDGLIVGKKYSGDAGSLSNIPAANLVGAIPNANYANYSNLTNKVISSDQPNITSLGTLTELTIATPELPLSNPIEFTQTWNGDGILFTGVKTNIVDNASAPDSLITDMQVNDTSVFSVDKQGNVTANNFIGNLVGNFSGNIAAPGSNTQLVYNDSGILGGSANLTFNKATGVLTTRLANFSTGTVTASTPINFTQTWNNAQITFTGIRQNIVDNFSDVNSLLIDLQVTGSSKFKVDKSGNTTAQRYFGSGAGLTNLPAANLVGEVPNANYSIYSGTADQANIAYEVSNSAQPNITSLGNLVSFRANTGVITSNSVFSFLQSWNNSSEQFTALRLNVTDTNSTSDSVLLNLERNGDTQFSVDKYGNVVANNITAQSISGEAGNISNIPAANIVGVVSNSAFSSDSDYAANAGYANVAGTVSTNAQPNITSVGTLTGLTISTGALSDSKPLSITQTWQNGQANFTGIGLYVTNTTSNSNSLLMDLRVGGNSKAKITPAGDLTVTGNVTGNYILGDGGLLSNIPTGANANYANYAGNVVINYQPNITGLGTLSNLTVNGQVNINTANLVVDGIVTALDANLGNLVTANFISASGNYLSNIPAANLVGDVPLAQQVTNAAQPNITSVGTLTNVITSGDYIVSQSILTNSNKIAFTSAADSGGNPTITLGTPTSLTSGQYALASKLKAGDQISITGAINDAAGLNKTYTITSVGLTPSTVVSLIVTPDVITKGGGTSNVASVSLRALRTIVDTTTSGVTGYFDVANIGTLNTSNLVANTVSNAAQPNITSVGNLTGLVSNGVVNFTGASNVSLGTVGNIRITGGTNNYILTSNGAGGVQWTAPNPGGGLAIAYDYYTGNGLANSFTLGVTPMGKEYVIVNIDGIIQQQSAFQLAGNLLYFQNPPSNGEKIQVQTLRPTAGASGGLAAVGSNTQIQYNNNGDFGASSDLTFNSSIRTLSTFNLDIGGVANIGNVSNLRIAGGSANFVLTTDGAGNIRWAGAGGSPGVAGANTQVQFNDSNTLSASANFTFDKTTNKVTASFFAGDGSNLSNIQASNIAGNISAATANIANYVSQNSQPNITSVGTLTSLTVSGNVNAANFIGNFVGIASNATLSNVANTVSNSAQPNITSLGTLTSANVNGAVVITGTGGLQIQGAANTTPSTSGIYSGTIGDAPITVMYSNNATTNNKAWDTFVDGTGIMYGRLRDDAGSSTTNWMRVTRDNVTPNTITFFANTSIIGDLSANVVSGNGSGLTDIKIAPSLSNSDTVHYLLLANTTGSQNVLYSDLFSVNPSNGTLTAAKIQTDSATFNNQFILNAGVTEAYNSVSPTGANVTMNLLTGGVFDVTMTQNCTAVFTNVNTSNNYITGVSVFVTQGATPYIFSNAIVNGSDPLTIKWQGGNPPTGTATSTEVYGFSIVRKNGTYTVYGQTISFN